MKLEKYINFNGLLLPRQLFYFDSSRGENISPDASFDPVSAAVSSAKAFQSATSSLRGPEKKNILIDKSSVAIIGEENKIILIERLLTIGFKIYAFYGCGSYKSIHDMEDSNFIFDCLSSLGEFDEDRDYENLTNNLRISQDKSILMKPIDFSEIRYSLTRGICYKNGVLINGLSGSILGAGDRGFLQKFFSEEERNEGLCLAFILALNSDDENVLKQSFFVSVAHIIYSLHPNLLSYVKVPNKKVLISCGAEILDELNKVPGLKYPAETETEIKVENYEYLFWTFKAICYNSPNSEALLVWEDWLKNFSIFLNKLFKDEINRILSGLGYKETSGFAEAVSSSNYKLLSSLEQKKTPDLIKVVSNNGYKDLVLSYGFHYRDYPENQCPVHFYVPQTRYERAPDHIVYLSYLRKYYPNPIVVMEIGEVPSTASDDIDNPEKNRMARIARFILIGMLPKIRYIILPRYLERDLKVYRTRYPLEKIKIIYGGRPMVEYRSVADERTSNKIFIAQNGMVKSLSTTFDALSQFNMVSAGELLSGSIMPRIRTCIVECDYSKSFKERPYYPREFRDVATIASLTLEDLESYKTVSDSDKVICRFNCDLIKNKKFRLLSISAKDELLGIVGDVSDLSVDRGDDDFYYITSTKDVAINYVIRSSDPSKASDIRELQDNILDGDGRKIQEIIKEYKNSPSYKTKYSGDPPMPNMLSFGNKSDWLQEVYKARSGVCTQRSAAVANQMIAKGVPRNKIRIVRIDNNHRSLEVFVGEEKGWVAVDLGGGDVTLNYSSEKKFKADAVKPSLGKKVALACVALIAAPIVVIGVSCTKAKKYFTSKKPKVITKPEIEGNVVAEDWSVKDGEEEVKHQREGATEEPLPNLSQFLQDRLKAKLIEIEDKRWLLSIIETRSAGAGRFAGQDYKKALILTSDIENHANFLIKEAAKNGRPAFYLDSFAKINLDSRRVFIRPDDSVAFQYGGELGVFLDYCAANPGLEPLLLINWSAFDARQRLTLNTVLDEIKTIKGRVIGNHVKIVSLDNEASKDISFLSRHDACFESELDLKEEVPPSGDEVLEKVDLEGLPNWKKKLFGPVVLEGDKMVWNKSDFVKKVMEGKLHFEVFNLSEEGIKRLKYEVEQAKALGYFEYNGKRIPCSEEFILRFSGNNFDFSNLNPDVRHKAFSDKAFEEVPRDAVLTNASLFDRLLQNHIITDDGLYVELPGLIVKNSNKTLKLFITSDFSQSQWYCLFNEAKKHNVTLELYLASTISLPQWLVESFRCEDEAVAVEEEVKGGSTGIRADRPRIYVSKYADATVNNIVMARESYAIVGVEDLFYQDLVSRTSFDTTESGFVNFKKIKSELLTQLCSGKKIILKGQFSTELLKMLEPLLIGQAPEFADIGDKLTVIIEDRNFSVDQAVYRPLSWMNRSSYDIDANEGLRATLAEAYKEEFEEDADLNNSVAKSQNFIKRRRDSFVDNIIKNPMLQLIGHSGVGKSHLMRSIKRKYSQDFEICREFEAWANDNSHKTKILFIDESNIKDTFFTEFDPLKKGGNRRIFYKGKFYLLDENHRVVFARNSKEYGGGRIEQKLFEDGSIPEMHFSDFPPSYIYEKILKKSIYDKLSEAAKEALQRRNFHEADFKEECATLIAKYQALNQQAPNSLTPRELQEQVLEMLFKKVNRMPAVEIESSGFASTAATKEAEVAMQQAIGIRRLQQLEYLPKKALGLNGVLLEGDSGVGKSEMIRAILSSNEIKIIEEQPQHYGAGAGSGSGVPAVEGRVCYKIDANHSLEYKSATIIKAFKEGNSVWIDELNSCIDDGLEEILNAVLTGFDPKTGERSKNPGFFLFASTNKVGEGRSIISPALLHRMTCPKITKLKDYQVSDLEKIIKSWNDEFKKPENELIIKNIAADFREILQNSDGKTINLRVLKREVSDVFDTYKKHPYHLSRVVVPHADEERVIKVINKESGGDSAMLTPSSNPNISQLALYNLDGSESISTIWHNTSRGNSFRADKNKFSDQQITEALKSIIINAAREYGLSKNEAIRAIEYARKNGGISNVYNQESDSYEKNKDPLLPLSWRGFSRYYQQECEKLEIFTGRKNPKNIVGNRLAFVPNSVLDEIRSADFDGVIRPVGRS